jgi:hypothetical protein
MEIEGLAHVLQNLAEQFLAMMKFNNQLLEENLKLMRENEELRKR